MLRDSCWTLRMGCICACAWSKDSAARAALVSSAVQACACMASAHPGPKVHCSWLTEGCYLTWGFACMAGRCFYAVDTCCGSRQASCHEQPVRFYIPERNPNDGALP